MVLLIVAGIAILIFLVFLFIFFSFIRLWIQCSADRGRDRHLDLIGMKLRNVDYGMIVRQKIALVQAGVKVTTEDLEAHYLARGNVPKTATAVIAAHKAGIDLPWRTAAAIDLAGRDVLDAVRTSVNPKVIDCPDPAKGQQFLDGVCKNGIQLLAKARVTVRTKLDRLVGGATEETIIARVGEGIVKAIGSAEDHKDVLANPEHDLADRAAQLARFADGVRDRVDRHRRHRRRREHRGQAAGRPGRPRTCGSPRPRPRSAGPPPWPASRKCGRWCEENRAKVVLAEAEVPLAIADAFRDGQLGVMDLLQHEEPAIRYVDAKQHRQYDGRQ